MSRTFTEIRSKYAKEISKKLQFIIHSTEWKECVKIMNLENYDFVVPNINYCEEISKLATDNYVNRNELTEVLQISKHNASIQMGQKIKFILENGRGLMVINKKTQSIAGFSSFLDVCDLTEFVHISQRNSELGNVKYIAELMKTLYENNDIKFDKYGKYVEGGTAFIDKNYQKIGVLPALFIIGTIILGELGYEGVYGESTNARLSNAIKLQNGIVIKSIDWKHYVFENGKTMKDFMNEIKDIKNQQYIDKISKNIVVELLYVDYKKLYNREKYGSEAWKLFIRRNVKLFKMLKIQKSKL
eukprot:223672_1